VAIKTEIERKKTAISGNQDRNRENENSNTLNIVEEENRRNITHPSTRIRVIRVAQSLVFCVIYCEPWFVVSSIFFFYDI
jgi:hypothetical protein